MEQLTVQDIENEFAKLPNNYKTKDVDMLNKKLIRENKDVSCLKNIVKYEQKYHRTYFQVSLGLLKTIDKKLDFIENNNNLLQDWWHVDQLTQFIKKITFEQAYKRATNYINHPNTFLRRWSYVVFMPTLVKDEKNFELITKLLKNDDEYYVIMAEAWLISYLAIYHPEKTFYYLNNCNLSYKIVSKAISKICDSFQIEQNIKNKFKEIRKKY